MMVMMIMSFDLVNNVEERRSEKLHEPRTPGKIPRGSDRKLLQKAPHSKAVDFRVVDLREDFSLESDIDTFSSLNSLPSTLRLCSMCWRGDRTLRDVQTAQKSI